MPFDPLRRAADHVTLSRRKSPGIAKIVGLAKPRLWAEQAGFGLSGGFVIFRGIKLARFTLDLRLVNQRHWDDWHAWEDLVAEPKRGTPGTGLAQDIWHPLLEDRRIRSVVVEDVQGPEQEGDTGIWLVKIPLIEYRKPRPQYAKPDAPQATEEDPFDRQIRELSGQVRELAT